jgi:hypothetical protein
MKPPFYRFSLARTYFEAAKTIQPFRWDVWANLASLSALEHRREEGKRELAITKTLEKKEQASNLGAPYLEEVLNELQ